MLMLIPGPLSRSGGAYYLKIILLRSIPGLDSLAEEYRSCNWL